MSVINIKQLLEAGVHFGHQTRRWNPKMAPYIFTERNGIYIIDLQKTVKKIEEAYAKTETPVVSKDKKSGITKVTVDHTNLHSVPKTLEAGSVYLFDVYLELCVNKIAELARDDFEKVFLIHDAIWYLVSYDNLSYKILDPTNQDYVSNLKRGVCVCEGFAKLFSQMCLLMDIPACDVYGWGVSQTDNGQEQGGLHAWNIVMVQNKWYTIDVTWDCSHFENGKRDDMYSTDYIFQKPKEFVKMHHPSSPEFQLLKKPLKFGSVENIVKYQGV